MRVLLAEDSKVSCKLLEMALTEWGYHVVAVHDGIQALEVLQGPKPPRLAILDWMMPGLDGPEVCQRLRQQPTAEPPYLLLLTARDAKQDVVAGLRSGANDYVTKPCNAGELQARLQIGRQVVELQRSLAARVAELEKALAQVKRLQGLLPICCYCKKIRDDQNYWHQVDTYITNHSSAVFSHGICPGCLEHALGPKDERTRRLPLDHLRPGCEVFQLEDLTPACPGPQAKLTGLV